MSEYHLPADARKRLCAYLTGSDVCSAAGITVTANAPVLELCRRLVEVGVAPATPMHVYRGATLALIVRTIGEVADLEINGRGTDFQRRRAVGMGASARLTRHSLAAARAGARR
jgi:hypothetical protein